MAIEATRAITPGQTITAEAGGALPVYLPDAVFRESFKQQLLMQGFDVQRVDVTSAYGLTSRDYKATAIVTTLASTKVSNVIAMIANAAETAGSYSPTVTIPALGQASQAAPARSVLESTINDLVEGVGIAGKGIAKAPEELFSGVRLIVIGLVVIVGFLALGPNLRGIGRSAGRLV